MKRQALGLYSENDHRNLEQEKSSFQETKSMALSDHEPNPASPARWSSLLQPQPLVALANVDCQVKRSGAEFFVEKDLCQVDWPGVGRWPASEASERRLSAAM